MYEAGIVASFDAQHTMHGMEGPEGVLHSHDYRIEVTASRSELDDAGMVVDLDVLQAAIDDLVGRVKGRDLDDIVVPRTSESVTVEAFSRWIHSEIERAVGPGVERLHVRTWENENAFGGYAAP